MPDYVRSAAAPHAVAYGYDPDGNAATETHHHGCNPNGSCDAGKSVSNWCTPSIKIAKGTTCKYYDGLDRLVEVKLPQAPSDAYENPWVTRYLYDLDDTQKTFHGAQFYAYGNLFATQELLPTTSTPSITEGGPPQSINNNAYLNIKATAYDGADRAVAKYSLVSRSLSTETLTWDVDGNLDPNGVAGLLGEDCNMLSQCQVFDYRKDGKEETFQSSDGSSPERDYVYDPDGRTATITSSSVFQYPQQYTYNVDGELATSVDPYGEKSGYDDMAPATVTHNYFADGLISSIDVSDPNPKALNQTGLFSYAYRQDGLVETEAINDTNVANILHWYWASSDRTYVL